MDKDYALLIGVRDYPHAGPELDNLPAALPDCKELKRWLQSPKGGNVPRKNCIVLNSTAQGYPSNQDIDDAFEKIFKKARENGEPRRLYFYFSGHGFGLFRDDTALVLPSWSNESVNAAISSRTYLNMIWNTDIFQQVVLWIDCCRSARVRVAPMSSRINFGRGENPSKTYVNYSTTFQDSAYYAQFGETKYSSLFTKVLVQGLQKTEVIDSHDLAAYLKKCVAQEAMEKNWRQVPESIHYETAPRDILFRPYSSLAGSPATASTLHQNIH